MKRSNLSIADRIKKARFFLLEKLPYKPIFIFTGLLATIWFLVRVIPKPSRAGYPCMRAAAPLMSGFVLYILSFTTAFAAIRKSRSLLKKRSYLSAVLLLVVGLTSAGVFFVFHNQQPVFASPAIMNEPPDGANNPMGTEQGIIPGRVVWAWNADATNENCQNKPGNSYWDYINNDTLVIRGMVEESVLEVAGKTNIAESWNALFENHNLKKHGEARGYQAGEKIFIKINQGTATWLLTAQEKAAGFAIQQSGTIQPSWRASYYAAAETGPFVVLNLLRQLINVAGIPQENIYVGDPMSDIYDHNYTVWNNEFPSVKYADKNTDKFNRTLILEAFDPTMNYSDEGTILKEKQEWYFEEMEAANYMINVACLKSHVRAGVTLCAKNHFGSISRSGASHLHPGLVSTSDNGLDQSNTGYNKYRVLVDIMGHKFLGGNTMLFVIEGLYGGSESEIKPGRKWNMAPFNGDWSSSIFMSVDQVALESVCYDFLRTEYNGVNQPEQYPNWVGVDDYLHQAAESKNWPEGFVYNPDGEGALKSLGVHEHWNDPVNKQYSRNLGEDFGIELKQISGKLVSAKQIFSKSLFLKTYPNPFSNELNISFGLDEPALINISVYNLEGKMIEVLENSDFGTGTHEIRWSAANKGLLAGNYLVKLSATTQNGNYFQSQKVQLIK